MAEKLTEIELSGIELTDGDPRPLGKDPAYTALQEDTIETSCGMIHVAIQGDRSKPAILTYHDIGMNHITCFQGFFNFHEMQPILRHFCVYHVNAPGQHEGAVPLTTNDIKKDEKEGLLAGGGTGSRSGYPSMDQLGESLVSVLQFYNIRSIIGFGVGAGAQVLSRFSLSHPDKVDAIFLINPTASAASWSEWAYQKLNVWYLRSEKITQFTEDYLLWYWFGKEYKEKNHDLVQVAKNNIKLINPHNLAMFIESYINRGDLGIVREMDPIKKQNAKTIKCSVMVVVGAKSPHVDASVNMNSRLDPSNSNFMKISDCSGMVLEEQPAKVCEAFRLFLQGMGHVPSLNQKRMAAARGYELHQHNVVEATASVQEIC